MTTTACEKLGIPHPIILAPMGGAVGPALTAAVSNAGGLGLIPIWEKEDEDLRTQIRATRTLTRKPFGVNLNMDFPQDRHLDACLEEGVGIVSFFWKNPGALVQRAKDAGALVMQTVADSETARRAVENGVDIVVAQGWEAGGHVRGTVATLPLIPAVVDAVGDTPVIAAGGIGDGRGLAAVLALGASAGWIGTRFLASEEATIHDHYRRRILDSRENGTVYLENLFDLGWPDAPHRTLRNATVTNWEAAGRPPSGQRPGEGDVIGSTSRGEDILRYEATSPHAGASGQLDDLPMWAGQSAGLVRQTKPAAQIVDDLLSEARAALSGLNL